MNAMLSSRLFKWLVAPLAVVFGLGYGWYQLQFPTCTFRYKLTAEIETPNGLKTGSSVVEVSYSHSADWGGGAQPKNTVVGDALYVDLGQGKNVFVTLTSAESGRPTAGTWGKFMPDDKERGSTNIFGIPLRVFDVQWKLGQERRVCDLIASKGKDKTADVPFDWLPTLVTFSDLKNPDTSRVIQPDNFEAEFGVGIILKNVQIGLSDEAVVQRLERVLTWLPDMREKWAKKNHSWKAG